MEIAACGKRGGNPVREWHGEKMDGKSEAPRSNDCLQNGRPDTVEGLGGISHGRWVQYSTLGMKKLAT